MDIEDHVVLDRIVDIQRKFEETGADLKPVERVNLHFTLVFLGEIDQAQKEAICMRLRSLDAPPVPVKIEGVGAFPGPGKPRVIWLGIQRGADELKRYADMAKKIAIDSGVVLKQEEFSPHLTIARVRSLYNKERLTEELQKASNIEIGETVTSPIRLKRSSLTPKGPLYEVLCEST